MSQDLSFLGPQGAGNDLAASKNFPGAQYIPQETSGIYQEQREVNGYFWNVQNATYNSFSNQWLLVDPSKAGRALVSGGGQFAFYLAPAGVQPVVWTSMWSITDHGVASLSLQIASLPSNVDLSGIGIYNVLAPKYGMVSGVNTPTQAAANTIALQNACSDALTNGGAVYIPTGINGEYYVNPGINITGTGTRTFGLFGTTDKAILHVPASSGGGNLFTVTVAGGGPSAMYFQNLQIKYDVPLTGSAISLQGTQDVFIDSIFFDECPTAIQSIHSLQTTVTRCTSQTASQPNSTIILCSAQGGHPFGTQVFNMESCLFRQAGLVILGNIGMFCGQGNVYIIRDVQFSGFDKYGIQIQSNSSQGVQYGYFENLDVITDGTALFIQPAGPTYPTACLYFSNCTFRHQHWHGKPFDALPGVYIDTNGGPAQNTAGIRFMGCTVDSFGGSGVFINNGQHIAFYGGRYSGNNLGKNGTQGGISMVGGSDLEISSASCIGKGDIEPGIQPYGIYLDGGVFNVFIDHTNVRSNSQAPFAFGAPGNNIQVTNCPGYNDQGTVVTTTAPAAGTNFAPAQLGTVPYYGPVEVYIAGASTIVVNGQTTGLTGTSVYMRPGGGDVMKYTGTPSNFTAIGK